MNTEKEINSNIINIKDITNTNNSVNFNEKIAKHDNNITESDTTDTDIDNIYKNNKKKLKRSYNEMNNELNLTSKLLKLNIFRCETQFDGKNNVIVCEIEPINKIRTAIFYNTSIENIEYHEILTTDYIIKNNIFHVKSFNSNGKQAKKRRFNNTLNQISKKKQTKNRNKASKFLFTGYLIGVSAQRKLNGNTYGYYADCLLIDKQGKRYRFRAFTKELNRLKPLLKEFNLFTIKNFKIYDGQNNLYTITPRSKFINTGKTLTKEILYNYINLTNIETVLSKGLDSNNIYDVIGTVIKKKKI